MRTLLAIVCTCSMLFCGPWVAPAEETLRPLSGEGPVIGQAFPEVEFLDTGGHTLRISALRGKVVVLTFGSCFADRCVSTFGALDTLLADQPQERLSPLYVCCEMPPSLSRDGFTTLRNRCGHDRTYLLDTDREIKARLRVHLLPTTFLIDSDGTTLARVRGIPDLNGRDFRSVLAKAVTPAP